MRTSPRVRSLAAAFAVLLLVLPAVAGALPSRPSGTPGGANGSAELSVPEAVEKVLPSFVFIGGGSGVVISADGWMITNNHVIGGPQGLRQHTVILRGGREFTARAVGTDPRADVALLKIETEEELPYAEFAETRDLPHGMSVIAVGNPFLSGSNDREPTVTFGVLSACHIGSGNHLDALQVDAPINPGNSGGPLFNLRGELLGINASINPRFNTIKANTGIGHTVPAHVIQRLIPVLREPGGTINHAQLPQLPLDESFDWGEGARIGAVPEGSAAAGAGLREGDIVEAIDGVPVVSAWHLGILAASFPAAAEARLAVRRGEEIIEVSLPLGALETPKRGVLGVRLAPDSAPPRIESVEPDGPAAQAGLQPGDVIKTFAGRVCPSLRHLQAYLQQSRAGQAIQLGIERDGQEMQLRIVLGEAGE